MKVKLKAWWRTVRPGILAPILYPLVLGIGRSLRLKVVGFDPFVNPDEALVFAGWHGKSMVPAVYFRQRGYYVIISHSRDGEIQNGVFTRFGFKAIRGSSGRGGVKALIESVRVLKEGARMALTPDGPRGPSGVVQDGIIMMAQKSGAGMVPVGVAARPCWHVKTWDRYMVPVPFSRTVLIFGEPLYVARTANRDEMEMARLQLQTEIHRIQAEAERLVEQG